MELILQLNITHLVRILGDVVEGDEAGDKLAIQIVARLVDCSQTPEGVVEGILAEAERAIYRENSDLATSNQNIENLLVQSGGVFQWWLSWVKQFICCSLTATSHVVFWNLAFRRPFLVFRSPCL